MSFSLKLGIGLMAMSILLTIYGFRSRRDRGWGNVFAGLGMIFVSLGTVIPQLIQSETLSIVIALVLLGGVVLSFLAEFRAIRAHCRRSPTG